MVALVAALGLGCAGKTARVDPDSEDDGLLGAIGSKDVRSACFQFAQSLIQKPQIQRAGSPPTIAFLSVDNKSNELLDMDQLMYRMRTELMKNAGDKLIFLDSDIVDQIRAERTAKARGEVSSSGSKALYGADYFLTGRVDGIDRSRGREATRYLRLSLRLTDAESSAVIWEDQYECKKYRKAGVYDR